MSDIVTITQDSLQPPSPTTSDISNDSEKDVTRVFFGSLKSPEKRFAAIAAVPEPKSGIVVSASLQNNVEQLDQRSKSSSPSSPSTCSDEIMDVERLVVLVEEPEGGNEGHVDDLQGSDLPDYDEPSSALASKLLLALDNPSPPPSSTVHTSHEAVEMWPGEGIIISGENESVSQFLDDIPLALTAQLDDAPITPHPSSEPDLMAFDSIDGFSDHIAPLPLNPTDSPQNSPPSPFSFPDNPVATSSTAHHTSESLDGPSGVLIDLRDDGATSNVATSVNRGQEWPDPGVDKIPSEVSNDFQQVASATSLSKSLEATSNPVSPPGSRQSSNIPTADIIQQTPLRRSSRPRKSITPHYLEYLAFPRSRNDQGSPLPSGHSINQSLIKSRKGKERAVSPCSFEKDPEPEAEPEPKGHLFKLDDKQSNMNSKRRYSQSPVRQQTTRELSSLSPNSADLLTRLMPSVTPLVESTPLHNSYSVAQGSTSNLKSLSSETTSPQISLLTSQEPPILESTPIIPSKSGRFSNPSRPPITPQKAHVLHSTSKAPPQQRLLDDLSRTPARRVPFEQAVAEGRVSPQKFLQMQTGIPAPVNLFTGQAMPILNTALKGDTSPARRVFVAPTTDREVASHPKTPSKDRPLGPGNQQPNRPTVPSLQKVSTTPRQSKLPYPLVETPKGKVNPEQNGAKDGQSPTPGSPTKSSLKQTRSRIPRKKPYAKPGTSSSTIAVVKESTSRTAEQLQSLGGTTILKKSVKSTQPTLALQGGVTSTKATKRVIRAVDLSKSTTYKFNHLASPPPTSESIPFTTDTDALDDAPPVGHLKRKRLDSKIRSDAKPRSTTLRQVPAVLPSTFTTTYSRPNSSSSSRANPPSNSRTQSRTSKKPVVMKFRRVMMSEPAAQITTTCKELGQSTTLSLSSQLDIQDVHRPQDKNGLHPSTTKEGTVQSSSAPASPPNTIPLMSAPSTTTSHPPSPPAMTPFLSSPPTITFLPTSPSPPPPPLVFVIDPLSPVSDPTTESADDNPFGPGARRTTRLRKPTQIQPGSGGLSSDLNTTSQKTRAQQRRRSKTSQNSRSNNDDIFLGMSDKALKSLTAHNTVRNQQYAVANLETEIVRKEGARPESPAVKIKTIVQREQEEKLKQREERAARRAKRHGESDIEADENVDETGCQSAAPTGEPRNLYLESLPAKHRRGAGEEEDYETPLKNIDGQVNGQRRVKWDRGLFTEVFLDEVVLGSKVPLKESTDTKGCLTTTAKTLRLDTLGNLTDLDNPLLDLTQENIVVQKFVYDDDVVLQPPVPVATDRNTRSKSKTSS